MVQRKSSFFSLPIVRGWLFVIAILVLVLCFPLYASLNLGYTESKGPFKNRTQVVDLEGDGDYDVLVSHTRWEGVDISWAGVGRLINQGNGKFAVARGPWVDDIGGFAAGAGDFDQDGDADVFIQDFGIRLMVNQGGLEGGVPNTFRSLGGINAPPAYNQGYRDMGGTIVTGDLNGDGRSDAFVAGCCYGLNPRKPGYEFPNAPSVSWVWINDGRVKNLQTGHILPMGFLDGKPIRQAALGDLDGDGDLDVFASVGKPTMGTIDSPGNLILINDGTGRLAAFEQSLGDMDSTSVTLGDVNGDGRLDALVGTNTGANLWMNQSQPAASGGPLFIPTNQSFEAVQTAKEKLQAWFSAAAGGLFGLYLPYGSTRTHSVFLEDLDGDGDLDALIGRLWWAEIWRNDGGGEFSRSDVRFEYPEDTGVAVADFDGDGDQDIFAAGNGEGYQVWKNDGQGVFTPYISLYISL